MRPTRDERVYIRVTPEEKAKLELEAQEAGLSLSTFTRWKLLRPDTPKPRRRRAVSKEALNV